MYKASVPDLATPGDTGGVALHKSLDLHQILAIGPTDLHLCHYRNNHIFIIITLQPGHCFFTVSRELSARAQVWGHLPGRMIYMSFIEIYGRT